MKVCIKKIYCTNCRRLVRCFEQATNGSVQVICTRCGKILRIWNGITWKSL